MENTLQRQSTALGAPPSALKALDILEANAAKLRDKVYVRRGVNGCM
jgi:hypothetical protein